MLWTLQLKLHFCLPFTFLPIYKKNERVQYQTFSRQLILWKLQVCREDTFTWSFFSWHVYWASERHFIPTKLSGTHKLCHKLAGWSNFAVENKRNLGFVVGWRLKWNNVMAVRAEVLFYRWKHVYSSMGGIEACSSEKTSVTFIAFFPAII